MMTLVEIKPMRGRHLAFALLLTPESYYVNVHTALFPAGAARGQLG